MASHLGDSHAAKTTMFCCIFTLLYLPLLILILLYYGTISNIGKISFLRSIFGIMFAEVFKLFITRYIPNDATTRDKSRTTKKVHKNRLKELCKCIVIMALMVIIYYVTSVLFGAPVLSNQEETLMFSILLTSLTVFPTCIRLGSDITVNILTRLTSYQGDMVVDMIVRNICFTLLGAWLGAVVIPLDWDRPWQVWPVPCCVSALIAYIISHCVTLAKLTPNLAKRLVKKTGKYGL